MARIFKLSHSGKRFNQGGDKTTLIDLDGPELKHRLDWLTTVTGLSPIRPAEVEIISSPGEGADLPPSNLPYGFVTYQTGAVSLKVDVLDAMYSTTAVAHSIRMEFGLAVDESLNYIPPAPARVSQDWESPNAPFSGPMPGRAGWFRDIQSGPQTVGDKWTGPSGTVYEYASMGGSGMFAYYGWKAQ